MRHIHFRRSQLAAFAALLISAAPATAQSPAAGSLPDADQLVSRYVDAIGGRDRILSAGASRMTGTFSMPAMGFEGRMEVIAAPPNRVRVRMEMPGMGTIENGFDGKVAWAVGPMGTQVLEGAELQAVSEEADVLAAVRDRSLFESVETVERTEMNGEACYKVKFVWKSGNTSFDCYSVESGLLVANIVSRPSPQGNIEMEQHYSNYEEHDGLVRPMRVVQRIMGQEQVITFESLTLGDVPDSEFEPPASVRSRIDGGRP